VWERALALRATQQQWATAHTAAELGFTELAVSYAEHLTVERAARLPELVRMLLPHAEPGHYERLLRLCAGEPALRATATQLLLRLYPTRAKEVLEEMLTV